MRIPASDYLLVCFCERSRQLLRSIANWETYFLDAALTTIPIARPVFVAGLARSGTTLLLELLSLADGVATHRYRDFPFVMTPVWWSRYLDKFPVKLEPVERPHRDGIHITRESPEAFEEPLWQLFFPHVHSRTARHRLTSADANDAFDKFYTDHLRKILLLRQGNRYLAKGNYNVARIEYLAHLFSDARFIVPVRDPRSHVQSLVRQHELFSEYAQEDRRVPRYLAAAGHYEFGPQRVPTRLTDHQGDRILAAWDRGEEYAGYGLQWAEVYGFIDTLRRTNAEIAERMLVVRYEDLCDQPDETMQRILNHVGIDKQHAGNALNRIGSITPLPPTQTIDDRAWGESFAEVQEVAGAYGYAFGS